MLPARQNKDVVALRQLPNFLGDVQSLLLHKQERKVWTSQEMMPVKRRGPKGYGKYHRKHTGGGLPPHRVKCEALGATPFPGDRNSGKPHQKQGNIKQYGTPPCF